jgi:hypothetical protein
MSLSLYGVPNRALRVEGGTRRPLCPYTHLPRRSGRSPALPYPPGRPVETTRGSGASQADLRRGMQTVIEQLQEQRNPRDRDIARYEGEYQTPACSRARFGELRTNPHYMPPRTTGNSCRRKVSDRTMVGKFTTGTSLK